MGSRRNPPQKADTATNAAASASEFTLMDLFSGIGGMSLGLEAAGFKTKIFCEIDPHCRAVLRKHWPDVEQSEDVETMGFVEGGADFISAGFPCQDISYANAVHGDRAGLAGTRSGLYRHVVRAFRVVRPQGGLLENVEALLGNGMGVVLSDLAEIGYDAEWHCIPASAVGAPQERDRVWIIADARKERKPGLVTSTNLGEARPWGPRGETDMLALADAPFERGHSWPQPLVRRNDDGASSRAHRVEQCGNAVVPQIPELIGRAILQSMTEAAE